MDNKLETKTIQFNPCSSMSCIEKLDDKISRPKCFGIGSSPEYKLSITVLNNTTKTTGIYMSNEQVLNIFKEGIYHCMENRDKKVYIVENIVYPDERYLYNTHELISDKLIFKILYNKPYKLIAKIVIAPEDKHTGRIEIKISMSYKYIIARKPNSIQPETIRLNENQCKEFVDKLKCI